MNQAFDPYTEWLRIPQSTRPPQSFQLLGLASGEMDVSRINAAFEERYECVRKYQNGRHSETALRILVELSNASESMKALASQQRTRIKASRVDVEDVEPFKSEADLEIIHFTEDASLPSHSPSNLAASSPGLQHVQSAPPKITPETYFDKTDKQYAGGEYDLLQRWVTRLAIANGIISILLLWLPSVAVCFVALAIVYGCWHFVNVFNSPSWRVLWGRFAIWAKSKVITWESQRAAATTAANANRSGKKIRKRVASVARQLATLETRMASELLEVRDREFDSQIDAFLRSHTIREHLKGLPGIGGKRLSALASAGVVTAYDVHYGRIVATPGCGESVASSLTNWRAIISQQFTFDEKAIPKATLLAVEQKYAEMRRPLDGELRQLRDKARSFNDISKSELAASEAKVEDARQVSHRAWTEVQAQIGSLTKSHAAYVLTAMALPVLGYVLVTALM